MGYAPVGCRFKYGPHSRDDISGREAVDLANTFGVHVRVMVTHANLPQPPIPDAQHQADPAEQAIIGEAMDVLVATHGFKRATMKRRLREASTRARIRPLKAARAILLSAHN